MNYLIYEKGIAILKTKGEYKLLKYEKSPFYKGELLYKNKRGEVNDR